ncbi:gamma-glutamyltransferase [Fulvivirga kasyanovii]|uniref:Glutathione hydrolase proenzyme n=1 Tax=Fulvivirga kasyanovii TaxID=396812 RepID=A0ABW9RQP6_9BACT|nr:gamma-glutamyltransferase [Fulvivirga kasyanovii]MTI25609.1 gamma-glutamyltransferase [Fulvivirga kasyanovii]
MNIRLIIFLAIVSLFSCQSKEPVNELPLTGVIADSAMVVSAHPLASRVGIDIIKNGGNAVDAAVAVQFALAVVYPAAGNIGGGGFMVYRDHEGNTDALDFREAAPLASSRNMYLNENGEVIEELSRLGHLASGVPGTVDGMVTAHGKYGKLPWESLVQPAIDLARDGFPLTAMEARGLSSSIEDFKKYNTFPPSSFIKKWHEGDTLRLPDLANTLERIRDTKREGFYSGRTADLIVREMNRGGGIITYEDLKNYHSMWRKPTSAPYKNYKVISMPPPSSGGIALTQLLTMIEDLPVAEHGFHSPEAIHYMVEAERRVYADRATHLGDPDFYLVPAKDLTDRSYLKSRMEHVSESEATPSDSVAAGEFSLYESEETTHYSIVDKEGNAVAVTTTLNGSYGSHVVVDSAGFLLNNEMDDFSVKPGFPNMYGLIGGEANAIVPLKRMLSSMTPTIVEKEGKLYMVVGSPGGSTIITSVFQTVLNVIEFDMNMQQAVTAGRFHHQWKPDVVYVEKNSIDEDVLKALTKMGHTMEAREPIGRVDAILITPDGKLEGGADPRGDDMAIGF